MKNGGLEGRIEVSIMFLILTAMLGLFFFMPAELVDGALQRETRLIEESLGQPFSLALKTKTDRCFETFRVGIQAKKKVEAYVDSRKRGGRFTQFEKNVDDYLIQRFNVTRTWGYWCLRHVFLLKEIVFYWALALFALLSLGYFERRRIILDVRQPSPFRIAMFSRCLRWAVFGLVVFAAVPIPVPPMVFVGWVLAISVLVAMLMSRIQREI